MNDILDWMASPAELEKIEFERIVKEAEEAEYRRKHAKEIARREAEAKDWVIEYHHKHGYDYVAKKRCYCDVCYQDKDYLDEYYNEKGDWERG